MRFVLSLFCVEYVSVELCQQFRPSLMHRVGPTRGVGWRSPECYPMRSILQRDPQGPKQSYLLTHRHRKNTQAWIFVLFLPVSVAGCIVSERGGGAELCLYVPVCGRNDLHPVIVHGTGRETQPQMCPCPSSEVEELVTASVNGTFWVSGRIN